MIPSYIRVKAILFVERDKDEILVSESYDSVKHEFYYRPIGGTVEFGETTTEALKREIFEETGKQIAIQKLLNVSENIFTSDGQNGHEIVFTYLGHFIDQEMYENNEIWITEDNGQSIKCKWIKKTEFKEAKLRLVPEDLVDKI